MTYFTEDFKAFFRELSKNNNSEWFAENRKRYESAVKKPFQDFISEIINRCAKVDPAIKITPADAIMRINKDIRFSKDKTPYNTYVAAVISATGKKDKSVPGLYIQISHDKVTLYGGAYILDPVQLKKIRNAIAKNPKKFRELYSEKDFQKLFGQVKGEQSKRLDAGYHSVAGTEPLIANKQFYFTAELNVSVILKNDFADTVMKYFMAGLKLNNYFARALKAS